MGAPLAIIILPMRWTSSAMPRTYSKAIRPRKIAGRCVLGREDQRRVGRGEMVAAEIELVGHVALAGVDVFAVQAALALRAVKLLADRRVPLLLEVGDVAADAGHGIHAPHGPVAPGRIQQAGRPSGPAASW